MHNSDIKVETHCGRILPSAKPFVMILLAQTSGRNHLLAVTLVLSLMLIMAMMMRNYWSAITFSSSF